MPIGSLQVVATPIGNMEDITLRALRTLREVDLVAAEDTRHTGLLLARHGIRKPLISYHEFNEAKRTQELLERIQQGASIALVSDAGMPALSDPGLRLLQAAIQRDIPVTIVPGVSAVTTAVLASGLRPEPFLFHGFLPHKPSHRRKLLGSLAPLPFTMVFFESPYRVVKALADIESVLGDRHVVVARELTKKFEELVRGSASHVRKILEQRKIKGEITLIVEGQSK